MIFLTLATVLQLNLLDQQGKCPKNDGYFYPLLYVTGNFSRQNTYAPRTLINGMISVTVKTGQNQTILLNFPNDEQKNYSFTFGQGKKTKSMHFNYTTPDVPNYYNVTFKATQKKFHNCFTIVSKNVTVVDILPGPTPNITPTTTMSATPLITPLTTPRMTPSTTSSITPSITASITPSITASITPSITSSMTPSNTPSMIPSKTPCITPSKTFSATPSPTCLTTPSTTSSPTTRTTPFPTPSQKPSPTPSITPSSTKLTSPSSTPISTLFPTPITTSSITTHSTQQTTPSITPTVFPSTTYSDTTNTDSGQDGSATKKKIRSIIVIVVVCVIALLIIVGAVLSFIYLRNTDSELATEAETEEGEPETIIGIPNTDNTQTFDNPLFSSLNYEDDPFATVFSQ